MRKIIVSVLGHDRPGIIATVADVLFRSGCNIEDVSQTLLQTEFAGIFIASCPESLEQDELLDRLRAKLDPMGLSALLREMEETGIWEPPPVEPFVITTLGPDRLGLVAGVTELLARFGVNISNLKAVFRGGDDPNANTMIYEVDIPITVDQRLFREALRERGTELGIDISLQHREIFEAIHRV
jgi:glycine cleavage system transcriptional repressor